MIESPPYEVTEMGWGEFEITITVHFHADANEKPLVRGADASGATGASRLTQGGGMHFRRASVPLRSANPKC